MGEKLAMYGIRGVRGEGSYPADKLSARKVCRRQVGHEEKRQVERKSLGHGGRFTELVNWLTEIMLNLNTLR